MVCLPCLFSNVSDVSGIIQMIWPGLKKGCHMIWYWYSGLTRTKPGNRNNILHNVMMIHGTQRKRTLQRPLVKACSSD